MAKIENKEKTEFFSLRTVLTVLASVFVSLLICDFFKITDKEAIMRHIVELCFIGIAAYGIYEARKGKMNPDKLLCLILLAGLVMRIGYMIYTPWGTAFGGRGYDEGAINAKGHYSYLINWGLHWKLPNDNGEQFYQPPLNYFLSAIFIHIGAFFHGNSNGYMAAMKYAEVIPCMSTCVMLMANQATLDALKIERKYQIPAVAILAFFPNFFYLGGRINNDAILGAFMSLAVLFTLRWYYSQDIKDIIAIALSIGFGMMSKISCATVAFFTGPVMLFVLYKNYKNGTAMNIITQLAVFAVICFPLGMWYPIRNKILFGQELNYVQRLPITEAVYSGDTPWVSRFLTMPVIKELKRGIEFANSDTNIPMMVTKSAVIVAFDFSRVPKILRNVLYIINLIIIILSLVSMVYVSVKDKARDKFSRWSMLALWVIVFGSFLSFNVSYPYICTADMRYIPLTVMTGCAYLAMAYQMLDEKGIYKITVTAGKILTLAFCAMVFIMLF